MSVVGFLQCLMPISQYLAYYFLIGSAGRKIGGWVYLSQGCKPSLLFTWTAILVAAWPFILSTAFRLVTR